MEEDPTSEDAVVPNEKEKYVAIDETALVNSSLDEISVGEQSVESKISNGSSSGQQLSDWSTTVYTDEKLVEGLIKTWEVILPSAEGKGRDDGDCAIPDENEKTPLTRSTLLHHWSEHEDRSPEDRLAIKIGFWTDRGFLESHSDDFFLEPFAETVVDDNGNDIWTESQVISMDKNSSPQVQKKEISQDTNLLRLAVSAILEETVSLKPKADDDDTAQEHNSVDVAAMPHFSNDKLNGLEKKKDEKNYPDSFPFAAFNATVKLDTVATVAEPTNVNSLAKSQADNPSAKSAPKTINDDTTEVVTHDDNPPDVEKSTPEIINDDATEVVTHHDNPYAVEKSAPKIVNDDTTEVVTHDDNPSAIKIINDDTTVVVSHYDNPPAIEKSTQDIINDNTTGVVTPYHNPPAIEKLTPKIINDDTTEVFTHDDNPSAIKIINNDKTEVVTHDDKPSAIKIIINDTTEVVTHDDNPSAIEIINNDTTEVVTHDDNPSDVEIINDNITEVLAHDDKPSAIEIINDNTTEVVTHHDNPPVIEKSKQEIINDDTTEVVTPYHNSPAIEKLAPKIVNDDSTKVVTVVTDKSCGEPTSKVIVDESSSDLNADELRSYSDDVAAPAEHGVLKLKTDDLVVEGTKLNIEGVDDEGAECLVEEESVAEVDGFEQNPDSFSGQFPFVEEAIAETHLKPTTPSALNSLLHKVMATENEVYEEYPEIFDATPSGSLSVEQAVATSKAVDTLQERNPAEGVTVQTCPEPLIGEDSEHLLEERNIEDPTAEILTYKKLECLTLEQPLAINEAARMSILEGPPDNEEVDSPENKQDLDETVPVADPISLSRVIEMGNDDLQTRVYKIQSELSPTPLWRRRKFLAVLFCFLVALVGGVVGAIIASSGSGDRETGGAVDAIPPIEANTTSLPSGTARVPFTPSPSSPNFPPFTNLTPMPSKSFHSTQPPLARSTRPIFPPSSVPTFRESDTMAPSTTPTFRSDTIFPSPYPSLSDTTASSTADFLWSIALQGGAEFVDPNSYQFLAYKWITNITDPGTYNSTQIVQRYALACFYFSTYFDWTDSTGWLSNETECNWVGVVCNESGVLTGFSLEQNNLSGILPAELSLLTNVYAMWFSKNTGLFGTLPTEIGSLTLLESLNLFGCGLSGNIPSEFGNMTNMKNLWLSDNRFSGTIPATLGNLPHLGVLEVQGNDLSGEMPSEVCALDNFASELHYIQADCQEINCTCCEFCS